jgi:membrane protein
MEARSRSRWFAPFRVTYELARQTISGFSEDRAEILAAALAFYTMLSLAPVLIIAVAVAGTLLGTGEARHQVTELLAQAASASVAQTIDGWVDQAARAKGVASVVGGVLLLATAGKLFEQLKVALNTVFDVDEFAAEGFKSTVTSYVRRRLFAFAMVLGAGLVLLVVFASRTALEAASSRLFPGGTATLAWVGQVAFSLVLVGAIATVVLQLVPDTRVGWRAAAIGGVVTSVLFNVGNVLVGMYLGRATVTATYGAAGSLVVVLLWFFYSAQIFLLGAEVTHVVVCRWGRHLSPKDERDLARIERQAARERLSGRPSAKLHAQPG